MASLHAFGHHPSKSFEIVAAAERYKYIAGEELILLPCPIPGYTRRILHSRSWRIFETEKYWSKIQHAPKLCLHAVSDGDSDDTQTIAADNFAWSRTTASSLRLLICEVNTSTAIGDGARPRSLNSMVLEIASSSVVLPSTSLRPIRMMMRVNEMPYKESLGQQWADGWPINVR